MFQMRVRRLDHQMQILHPKVYQWFSVVTTELHPRLKESISQMESGGLKRIPKNELMHHATLRFLSEVFPAVVRCYMNLLCIVFYVATPHPFTRVLPHHQATVPMYYHTPLGYVGVALFILGEP
jgi:hypothetical protein